MRSHCEACSRRSRCPCPRSDEGVKPRRTPAGGKRDHNGPLICEPPRFLDIVRKLFVRDDCLIFVNPARTEGAEIELAAFDRKQGLAKGQARGGFFLSPFILATEEFGAYSTDARVALARTQKVTRVKVNSPSWAVFFEPRIRIKWFEFALDVDPQENRSIERTAKDWDIARVLLRDATGLVRPIMLPGPDSSKVGLRVTPPFASRIVPPTSAESFGFTVDVESGAWEATQSASDGIDVEVAVLGSGGRKVLLTQTIDPLRNEDQRVPVQISVPLGSIAVGEKLELRLLPRNNGANDNTNLLNFRFQ